MPPTDPESSGTDRDVLTSLPRTRPSRRSAKRDRPARGRAQTTPAGARPASSAGTTPPEDPAAAAATDTPARARRRPAATPKPVAAKPRAATKSRAATKPRAATRGRTTSSARTTAAAAAPETRSEPTVPPAGYATQPPPSNRRGPDPFALVTTTVQAAGEIAQIGATLWGQAVRSAISRLPKP